jgi:hypothetical protein
MENPISAIIYDYEMIADLQRADLTSTEQMPNWNASYMQLLKFERLFALDPQLKNNSGEKAEAITHFLEGTFAEMREELPKLVDNSNMGRALQLYAGMVNMLLSLVDDLTSYQQSSLSM